MMNHRIAVGPLLITLLCLALSGALSPAAFADETMPRLVLQITVDGLRGDLPHRFSGVLGEGGFRYLMEQGVWYANAHYEHANTETIVGHTSLATGTVPAAHGMVGNVWFDREADRLVYNIEDPEQHLLAAGADVDAKNEIDPTQRAAKVEGRSPANILTSTFSDELAIHFAGKSKVFAVSVKDRGAVPLAGHTGKAFWFSKAGGAFVTSSYYYDRNPDWVDAWNAGGAVAAYAGTEWNLLLPKEMYLFGEADDNAWETDFPGYGRTFPHAYGPGDDKYFTTKLTLSPAGDALTLDFAKTLLVEEKLGQDDVPDYLAVSFSSTDYVGHIFGPSSLESEDNLAHLDRTLAELFAFVDQEVGLENTLIVLSADHGQPEVPGFMQELGFSNAHFFDTESLDKTPAIAALKERFGLGAELIKAFFQPYLYLDRELIRAKGLDQAVVEEAVAAELLKFDGVAYAISARALDTSDVPNTLMTRAILKNHHAKRSGDIYVVFEPYVFINDFDGLVVASTHGSPWRYDTFVPVVFAGGGIKAAAVSRPVTPYDIAATLAARLHVKPPSGSVGVPLVEVVEK
jgi:hypothetical protein